MTKGKHASVEENYRVKVLGVGGGGIRALEQFRETMPLDIVSWLEPSEVEYWALDTDLETLSVSQPVRPLQLGPKTAGGKGSGADPELGRRALQESRTAVLEALEGADIVFIIASLGGGVGSGVAPLIAEMAHALPMAHWESHAGSRRYLSANSAVHNHVFTLTYVSMPSRHEGATPRQLASESLEELRDKGDSVVVVPVDDVDISQDESARASECAYTAANSLICVGIQTILNAAFSPSLSPIDLMDVMAVLRRSGVGRLGFGRAEGVQRAERAAGNALRSPSLGNAMDRAKGVLFGLRGNKSMTRYEVNEAADVIFAVPPQETFLIFSATVEAEVKDEIQVLIHAAGLPDDQGPAC